jgi:hypothetical protein
LPKHSTALSRLLHIAEPAIVDVTRRRAYAAAKIGVKLFSLTAGYRSVSPALGLLFCFRHRMIASTVFGGTLSLAALAGAVGGMALGRFIDSGHGRSAVWINAGVDQCLPLGDRHRAAGDDVRECNSRSGGCRRHNSNAGFYLPSWMTAAYNAAKVAPCTFRFQFAEEGGGGAGGAFAGFVAAAFCALGQRSRRRYCWRCRRYWCKLSCLSAAIQSAELSRTPLSPLPRSRQA